MSLLSGLERLIKASALAMFAAMFVLTLAQVLFRYFLHLSVPWTEEVARALFVLATLSGIALAYRQRQHIVVDFLFLALSPRAQRVLSILFGVTILAFLALWARGALELAQRNWSISLITVRWFRTAYFYVWELAMIALLALYVLIDLKSLATGRITGLQAAEQEQDL